MAKQIEKNKLWIVIVLVLAFSMLYYSDAFAWGGHDRYHYRGGRWYKPGWFWGEVAVSALTFGAIITALPPHYSTVYVGGAPYYYDGSYYYRPSPDGYVVVANPGVIVPAAPVAVAPVRTPYVAPSNAITINVPNSRGGYTAVTLTRSGNGYIGPQGEYYEGNPTVDQLRALYGR